MKFRPLHDRVVIERIEAEAKTAGGIIIPDTAQEKPQQGKVSAVGPGGRDESGKLIPIDVKVGNGAAWVTNGADASVSRINLEDGSVERIPIGLSPGPLAIAFGSVWIIAGGTYDTIWRLNPETRQADAVIKVGKSPFNVAADAHGLWAALREAGTLVRIDPRTNTVSKTIHLGYKPQGMAVGAGAIWVTVGHGGLPALG